MIRFNNFTTVKTGKDGYLKTSGMNLNRSKQRVSLKDSAGHTKGKITYFPQIIIDLKWLDTDTGGNHAGKIS